MLTFELIPIKSEGRLSAMNFPSISTASLMMAWMTSGLSLFLRRE